MEELFKGTLDLGGWEKCAQRENYTYNAVSIPGLTQEVYRREVGGAQLSVGVFTYNGLPVYIAWGLQNAKHCSVHALLSPEKSIIEVREGCPEVLPVFDGDTVVGFTLDAKEKWVC